VVKLPNLGVENHRQGFEQANRAGPDGCRPKWEDYGADGENPYEARRT
jgi:hypothetical protein